MMDVSAFFGCGNKHYWRRQKDCAAIAQEFSMTNLVTRWRRLYFLFVLHKRCVSVHFQEDEVRACRIRLTVLHLHERKRVTFHAAVMVSFSD